MIWQERYAARLRTAEEAVQLVESGDTVTFTVGREPLALALALAARKEELRDVTVILPSPTHDIPWYDDGWQENFNLKVGYVFPRGAAREAFDAGRLDFQVGNVFMGADDGHIDLLITEISPPNDAGFCSFGSSVWTKPSQVRRAKKVIAEVNERLVRTHGDNYVHIDEIDVLVEHPHSGRKPGERSLLGDVKPAVSPLQQKIAENLAEVIRDGDTLQVGVGTVTEPVTSLGILESKRDLGWHSEVTPAGVIDLVRKGVMTGARKTLDSGKCIATAVGGASTAELEFISQNPLFELRESSYTNNITVIAQQRQMTAINSAIAVDLSGQVASESIGPRMWSGAGGQPAFAVGASLAPEGRTITVFPSTAAGGSTSRIVEYLPAGTIITVPRTVSNIIVTEFGVARLKGKSLSERRRELIAIAHPDFRKQLTDNRSFSFSTNPLIGG